MLLTKDDNGWMDHFEWTTVISAPDHLHLKNWGSVDRMARPKPPYFPTTSIILCVFVVKTLVIFYFNISFSTWHFRWKSKSGRCRLPTYQFGTGAAYQSTEVLSDQVFLWRASPVRIPLSSTWDLRSPQGSNFFGRSRSFELIAKEDKSEEGDNWEPLRDVIYRLFLRIISLIVNKFSKKSSKTANCIRLLVYFAVRKPKADFSVSRCWVRLYHFFRNNFQAS